jgi:flavorubredoxin
MATVTEIAPDVFRICEHVTRFDLGFNVFLVRDEQPLIFHAGFKALFPAWKEGAAKVLDPTRIRWVMGSHFESDEWGSLNEWLALAPSAEAVAGPVGAGVNLADFSLRPPRALADGEVLSTGKHRFRFCSTVHLPHGWDAGMLFEETGRTLFCSDLFFHYGKVEPITRSSPIDRTRESLVRDQPSPFGNSIPFTPLTAKILEGLAGLSPATLAVMHGSSFAGDGASAIRELGSVLRELFG